MEEELERDKLMMEQQKAAEAYVRPSATSVRIAMPGAPTPRVKRAQTEPMKRPSSPATRLEEFKKLKASRTPRGRPNTPRLGLLSCPVFICHFKLFTRKIFTAL